MGGSDGPVAGTVLVLDPTVAVLGDGTLLLGGVPARLLRCSAAGARLVQAWAGGAAVGEARGERALAGRLVSAGLAHPTPPRDAGPGPPHVAVVVPAHGRPAELAACLALLGAAAETVVVDDGSPDPDALAAVAAEGGARVVRRPVAGGPAAARNAGLAATSAPFVAFVDSDTRPSDGWLAPLLAHFSDAAVGAVAPRVRVPAGAGAVAAYEAARSPLDLGGEPGTVGPGRRIGFVPAAALVVRRSALGRGPAFDERMRYGEDVDLVWRLDADGWAIRYEPAATVHHPSRADGRAWLLQRVGYGSAAGPLAARHPGQMRHVVLPAWALAPWALALAGRPLLGALVAAGATVRFAFRLPGGRPVRREALRLGARAHMQTARGVADAAWRVYAPLLLAAAVPSRRARVLAGAALVAAPLLDWRDRRPALDPLRWSALRAADDLAYGAGVWLGCARARTLGPLVPAVVGGPRPSKTRHADGGDDDGRLVRDGGGGAQAREEGAAALGLHGAGGGV